MQKCRRFWEIGAVLLVAFQISIAEKGPKEWEEWTNFSGGIGYTLSEQGPGWNGCLSHNRGKTIFYQAAFSVVNGNLGSHPYYLNSISLAAGLRHMDRFFLKAIFIGPSYNMGKIKNPEIPNIINEWSDANGWGIWTNLQFIFRPPPLPDVAFGIDIYSNWNRAKNNYGFRFALSFSNTTKKEW